ncbi:GHMP family kinase ATP-binding protein [Paenibacillus sp. MMS18-CY102]|uniref:GHMP family kinase ATP-binding protein n=1 Tax=Paenibacillus sp. MMS18-CY102 TaxID=2682849 RepID=UPI00136576BB|nr:GHMP kinase [Paenibacillus sp. MMS18-CY102]MWC30137.1 GHMP kinase [Paenibacillus sp. MMS18-CY102]
MIISKTPLRISFTGGGTDISSFYGTYGGAVISTAINKYIYVMVKERLDKKIRVVGTSLQEADRVEEIEHDLVREALKMTGIRHGVEIIIWADIPSGGTGLGSSSSLTVGLLHALYAYQDLVVSPMVLAEQACNIEIDVLQQPIGKQDQYAAALGGLRHYTFAADGDVYTERIQLNEEQRMNLESNLLLFYTGVTRSASAILNNQMEKKERNASMLLQIKEQCVDLKGELEQGNLAFMGTVMHAGWELKRKLANGITSERIDGWYETAMRAGAAGGKVAGAGGGGFLLFYADGETHPALRQALPLQEMAFAFDDCGTRIIVHND